MRVIMLFGFLLGILSPVFAAERIDLSRVPATPLKAFAAMPFSYVTLRHEADFKKKVHTRIQQTFQGYPIFGAEVIQHQDGAMDGVAYTGLAQDLINTSATVFTTAQSTKALQATIAAFANQNNLTVTPIDSHVELKVYVDEKQMAHWAFFITIYVKTPNGIPQNPTYIIDALDFHTYLIWENIKTLDHVSGGGLGGNERVGKIIYDGATDDRSALTILRDTQANQCYLENDEVTIYNFATQHLASFACSAIDYKHNQVYWDENFEQSNGGYSPANDALYYGGVIKALYQTWYGIPVLMSQGAPQKLKMVVHVTKDGFPFDNAFWDGRFQEMNFGDGWHLFYPLVSLDIAAHEISHGFTAQHSNLIYTKESGALDESFSDMAAMAAQYFVTGNNTWLIASDILKVNVPALRFMNNPPEDCLYFTKCSIDNVRDYKPDMDMHYASGIFNKAFYVLATSPDWNTQKAFNVMVQANRFHWTPTSTFAEAACGVVKATREYGYDVAAAQQAMSSVGIDTQGC